MQINHIKRPWERKHKQGNRYNPDPFYQSTTWKRTRAAFLLGESDLPDGRKISNQLCYECYLLGIAEPVHTVDHVDRIKAGGSKTDHNNMRSLCARHHAQKSARESNDMRHRVASPINKAMKYKKEISTLMDKIRSESRMSDDQLSTLNVTPQSLEKAIEAMVRSGKTKSHAVKALYGLWKDSAPKAAHATDKEMILMGFYVSPQNIWIHKDVALSITEELRLQLSFNDIENMVLQNKQ